MKYTIQGHAIELELHDGVFSPSLHGSSALGESIVVHKGESVLDVGTGTGLLAIVAAKCGGKVTAVDIATEAVALTKKNFKKNDISGVIKLGDLFEPVKDETFDVIIANVPQENLSPAVITSLSPDVVQGMHGGKNGNEILLRTISAASKHMHEHSRLYIVVYSMSNFRESLAKITTSYHAKLVTFHTGPVKEFVYTDRTWYEKQSEKGLVSIYKKGDQYFADLFVFELMRR